MGSNFHAPLDIEEPDEQEEQDLTQNIQVGELPIKIGDVFKIIDPDDNGKDERGDRVCTGIYDYKEYDRKVHVVSYHYKSSNFLNNQQNTNLTNAIKDWYHFSTVPQAGKMPGAFYWDKAEIILTGEKIQSY